MVQRWIQQGDNKTQKGKKEEREGGKRGDEKLQTVEAEKLEGDLFGIYRAQIFMWWCV